MAYATIPPYFSWVVDRVLAVSSHPYHHTHQQDWYHSKTIPNLTCLSFRVLPHHCATLYGNRPLRNICPQLYHLCNGSRPFLTKSGMYPRTPGRSHISRWQLIEALHTYLRSKSLMTYLRIIAKIFMTAFTGYQFVRLVICIYHHFRSLPPTPPTSYSPIMRFATHPDSIIKTSCWSYFTTFHQF